MRHRFSGKGSGPRRIALIPGAGFVAMAILLVSAAPASAQDEELGAASYPGMTTYSCRTDAIPISPGQNLNLFGITKTCPNAEKISGPGDASVFAPGSTAEGYVTRFRPSMTEVHDDGGQTTPSVWDLHLHHVVWLAPGGGPTFASGEEKTHVKSPQGYGLKVGGDANWGLNYMIHSLNAEGGRQIYITWEIDWVPETTPARTDINPVTVSGSTSPALPRSTRCSTPSAASTPTATASGCSPMTSRRIRRRPATRSGRISRPPMTGSFRAAGGRWCSGPATCTRGASTSICKWRVTGPTPAPSTATTRPRSGPCSAPTPSTTSPPGR